MADVLEECAVYGAWDAKRGALAGVDLDASFGPLRASVGGKGLRARRRGQPRDSGRGRDKSIESELLPPRAASDQAVHLASGFARLLILPPGSPAGAGSFSVDFESSRPLQLSMASQSRPTSVSLLGRTCIVLCIITVRSNRISAVEHTQDRSGLLHVLLLQLGGQRQFLLRGFPPAQAGVTQTQVVVRLVRVGSYSRRLL